MITLPLEVRREGGAVRLLYNGRPVAVDPAVTAQLEALPDGRGEFTCEYAQGGLVVRGVGRPSGPAEPPIGSKLTRIVNERRYEDALRELESLGEARVRRELDLLLLRLRSRLALKTLDPAAVDFRLLLELTDGRQTRAAEPPAVEALLGGFPAEMRATLLPEFAAWLARHPDVPEVWSPGFLLYSLAFDRWPLELLLATLADEVRRKHAGDSLPGMIAAAKGRAAGDPRIAAAERFVQESRLEAVRRRDVARKERLGTPATVPTLEQELGINLPKELRAAWGRRDPRLIVLAERFLKDLLAESEAISKECFGDDLGRTAFAFLPIAREGRRVMGLYLAQPRPDGDYAVVQIERGKTDVTLLSESSALWLAPKK